jgi:CRISPR-associated endonuclease Cas2
VFNLLDGYGQRLQFSAFECVLSDRKFVELRSRLVKVVKMDVDSVRFYPKAVNSLMVISHHDVDLNNKLIAFEDSL